MCACVGPEFHRPAPPAVDALHRRSRCRAQTAAAAGAGRWRRKRFLAGAGRAAQLVDAVRLRGTRCAGRRGAARQSRRSPRRRRHCARRARTPPRSAAVYFPTVQGDVRAQPQSRRHRRAAADLQSGTPLYNLFTPQVTVSYVPDMFGGESPPGGVAGRAGRGQPRFQLDATYLTLTANVVTAAMQEAGSAGADRARPSG